LAEPQLAAARGTVQLRRTELIPTIMENSEILAWLREDNPGRLAELWQRADQTRQQHVGGEVHLRGLVEISNYCIRLCAYCGLRAPNTDLQRYRMTREEILGCVRQAVAFRYGTVVLQAGEDPGIEADWMAELVRQIKRQTPLAVTLSLGERSDEELALWRAAGADRYLLRFETSNAKLYQRIHPPRPGQRLDRIAMLGRLRALGYEVGSGVMIGIPGQSYEDLADDIRMFDKLGLDMIGVGPYLPHPATPLGEGGGQPLIPGDGQVPNNELTTYKVIALARLTCPRANIPSTTALATLNLRQGRELGLVRGANVIMPNLTPPQYRALYEIYPSKACIRETGQQCHACVTARIENLGREVGQGRGDSPGYRHQLSQSRTD
jgi:biotin synthase